MNDIKELYSLAVQTAKAAGDRLNGITQRTVNCDAGNDVKLQEDIESEKFIRNLLAVSNIPVVGEELEKDTSPMENDGYYWVVDPIDGTINFANGSRLWGIQISFSIDGDIKFGIIYMPEYDDILYAAKGHGAYKNGLKLNINIDNSKPQLVAVDYSKDINRFFFENEKTIEKYTLRIRSFGVGCFGFYSVACSQVGTYILACSNPWDLLPGIIICKEAGATVYQQMIDGEKVTFVTTNNTFASRLGFKKKDII